MRSRFLRSGRACGAVMVAVFVLGCAFAADARASGSLRFRQTRHYQLPGPPTSMVGADVTGDGRPDLVVSLLVIPEYGDPKPRLVLIRGTGKNRLGTRRVLERGRPFTRIQAADLTGDGRTDLVGISVHHVAVMTQGPHGLGDLNLIGRRWYPVSVAVGDMNGDGRLDLVVGRRSSTGDQHGFLIATHTASGWHARTFPGFRTVWAAVTMDVNHDGRLDIVACPKPRTCGSPVVYVRRRNGGFKEVDPLATSSKASSYSDYAGVFAGHFNDDAFEDVYAVGAGIFRGTSTGLRLRGMQLSGWIGVADMNRDGRSDVVGIIPDEAYSHAWAVIRWLTSDDGPGGATIPMQSSTGGPDLVVLADFNGDGFPDITTSHLDKVDFKPSLR